MNRIETALLTTVADRADVHHRWTGLIAQATPTKHRGPVDTVTLASPRRTRLGNLPAASLPLLHG